MVKYSPRIHTVHQRFSWLLPYVVILNCKKKGYFIKYFIFCYKCFMPLTSWSLRPLNLEEADKAVLENRDESVFAASSTNIWCVTYCECTENANEEEDTETIYDDLNNGEDFDWNEEVKNFKKIIKSSQPASRKREAPRSRIFGKFRKMSAANRSPKE
ncbi:unnamed protein product [Rhizopus stolonifer]